MPDFFQASEVEILSYGMRITLTDGKTFEAPFNERLRHAPRKVRRNCEISAGGTRLSWPDLDEHLNVDELYYDRVDSPPLMRECRFCTERTRWNSTTCDNCGKERWNDPDDTDLGRALGEEERTNFQVALARARLDGAVDNFLNAFVDASLDDAFDLSGEDDEQ